ncbi:MAG: ABC transporter permease subunit, partial [Alphaproteobacteria bacterium]
MEAQFETGLGGWQAVSKHVALFVLLMAIWEMANRLGADPLLFPRPTAIVAGMADIFFIDGNIWPHFGSTVLKAMLGMAIGTAIGMALGVGAALHRGFREYLKPYIVLIEATPRIAVGPIFVAALGFGIGSAVALAALVCFFAPFVNTLTGLMSVDEEA